MVDQLKDDQDMDGIRSELGNPRCPISQTTLEKGQGRYPKLGFKLVGVNGYRAWERGEREGVSPIILVGSLNFIALAEWVFFPYHFHFFLIYKALEFGQIPEIDQIKSPRNWGNEDPSSKGTSSPRSESYCAWE